MFDQFAAQRDAKVIIRVRERIALYVEIAKLEGVRFRLADVFLRDGFVNGFLLRRPEISAVNFAVASNTF
jgi:hypothetical protein